MSAYRRLHRLVPLWGGTDVEVFKARLEGPLGLERLVLAKRTNKLGTHREESAQSLLREARTYARLDHPALPRLVDFYPEEGRLVLLTAWIERAPLESLLTAVRARGGRLPHAVAFQLGTQLFAALAAAHGARDPMTGEPEPVVHGGVSPKTIMIGARGQLLLGDFEHGRTLSSPDMTPSGPLGGHEAYRAPEQVRGEPASARSDIYSACLVLRELLLGEPAFHGDESDYAGWLGRIAHPKLADIGLLMPDLDPSVRWLLGIGLGVDPETRNVTALTAAQLLSPLAAAGGGLPILRTLVKRLELSGEEPMYGPGPITSRTIGPIDRHKPAIDQARLTPEPTVREVGSRRTLPSMRKRRRFDRLVALTVLATCLGVGAFILAGRLRAPIVVAARTTLGPLASIVPTPSVATSTPAPSASSTPPRRLELVSGTLVTSEETRLLAATGLEGVFHRCFGNDAQPQSGASLRSRCTGGPTLTILIVKPLRGPSRRIAAYTEIPFEAPGWGRDPHAFLFSLDRGRPFPVKEPSYATDNRNVTFGPSFGAGHDLHIEGSLAKGWCGPQSYLTRAEARDVLGGAGPFRVERIEVFVARTPKR